MENIQKKNALIITITVIVSCLIMALIEIKMEPQYYIKSLLKILIFLSLPLSTMKLLKIEMSKKDKTIDKKKIVKLLIMGLGIYLIIMLAYLIANSFFDFSTLIHSLSIDQNVNSKDFILVALYISLCNSLLEEFMFRYISFIKLSEFISKKIAYLFSSVSFAIYHISMFGSSFPLSLVLITTIGLCIGGLIFDYVDEKDKNIFNSWIIHMFADFAIMTIWFINI